MLKPIIDHLEGEQKRVIANVVSGSFTDLTNIAPPPQPVTVVVSATYGPSTLPEMVTSPTSVPDVETVTLIQSPSPNDVAADPASRAGMMKWYKVS